MTEYAYSRNEDSISFEMSMSSMRSTAFDSLTVPVTGLSLAVRKVGCLAVTSRGPVTMVLMLPTAGDNGARLAAILPTGLTALALGNGADPFEVLTQAVSGTHEHADEAQHVFSSGAIRPLHSFILLVVDGLGYSNLHDMSGHARTLTRMPKKRIETVVPSTTAAALTTITTGRLPGEHGLVGYQIRHPEQGLVRPLNDWEGITNPRDWQRSTPLFSLANAIGVRSVAIGRPAHATGGLTEAILAGAEYLPGQTMRDRFAHVHALIRDARPFVAYLYVDELDREGHRGGWGSEKWVRHLESLDSQVNELVRALPQNVGIAFTADHGMVNALPHHQLALNVNNLPDVLLVGGEPRFRYFYVSDPSRIESVVDQLTAALGDAAHVVRRETAISAGWFGPIGAGVAERIGDVIAVARGTYALNLDDAETTGSTAMIGQHGSLSDEERGVPLGLGGALEGSGFHSAVVKIAKFAGAR